MITAKTHTGIVVLGYGCLNEDCDEHETTKCEDKKSQFDQDVPSSEYASQGHGCNCRGLIRGMEMVLPQTDIGVGRFWL